MDSSNFLDIDEVIEGRGIERISEAGWFSQSRGMHTIDNLTNNNDAFLGDNDQFTDLDMETIEMEIEEKEFAPQQSHELLHGRNKNSTIQAESGTAKRRATAQIEPQTILRLPESGISQRKSENSQFERVSAIMTHEQQTERDTQAFNLADLDSGRTIGENEKVISARHLHHENQSITNMASRYINIDQVNLVPDVEKKAVPIPPDHFSIINDLNSAEKRFKRSHGPIQQSTQVDTLHGQVLPMSQSFLGGSNAQGKRGVRDTPRFKRHAQKTSSLNTSQNQSLIDELQTGNLADNSNPSTYKKTTLAQLMPKQGRNPQKNNADSSHTSTVTTPANPTDGNKVKQMIKLVNKQNQMKQQQQQNKGYHQRQQTKVSLTYDGAFNFPQPTVMPPTPLSAGGLTEQNSAKNLVTVAKQQKSMKLSMIGNQTSHAEKKNSTSQLNKIGGLTITDFAKALQHRNQSTAQSQSVQNPNQMTGAQSHREKATNFQQFMQPGLNFQQQAAAAFNLTSSMGPLGTLSAQKTRPNEPTLKPSKSAKKKGQPTISSATEVKQLSLGTKQSSSKMIQNKRLFQKQFSQTIKFNGLSTGISPKASGDMPLDYSERKQKQKMKVFRGSSDDKKPELTCSNQGSPRKMDISSQGIIQQHQGDDTPLRLHTASQIGQEQLKKLPSHLRLMIGSKGVGGVATKKGVVGKRQMPIKQSITPTAENSLGSRFQFPTHSENQFFKVVDRRKIKVVKDNISPEGHVNRATKNFNKSQFERTQQVKAVKSIKGLDMESDEYLLGDEAAFDEEEDSMNEGIQMPQLLTHSQSQLEHHQLNGNQFLPKAENFKLRTQQNRYEETSSVKIDSRPERQREDVNGSSTTGREQDGQPFHLYNTQQENILNSQPQNNKEVEDVSIGDYQTLMQSTHISFNNNFNLNTDDLLRERPEFENTEQFETGNISNYLGHNLKSSDILRRSSPIDLHQIASGGDTSNSNSNFNNQRTHLGHEIPYQRSKGQGSHIQGRFINNKMVSGRNNIQDYSEERYVECTEENVGSSQKMFGSPKDQQVRVARKYSDKTKAQNKQKHLTKNYIKEFLKCKGCFAIVMSLVEISDCIKLKIICSAKSIQREPKTRDQFEKQFLIAMGMHRCNDPNLGGHSSRLCRVISKFYAQLMPAKTSNQQKMAQKKYQEQFKNGRVPLRASQELGVGFEIEKDVDRTFLDRDKFTDRHRLSLTVVLRSIAHVQQDVGYVQGLNFIIGNLLMQLEHLDERTAQLTCISTFLMYINELGFKNLYTDKMLGLKEAIFQLEVLLFNLMPEIYIFLTQNQILPDYFASQWFLTLFQYDVEDIEQSSLILLMAFVFGKKFIFQIAFQLINHIRSKLQCFSFEEALCYLKDFASEKHFRTNKFLIEALDNNLITNELLNELSNVYERMQRKLPRQSINSATQSPAMRVKFIQGSIPDKFSIRVIWGSSSQKDLLSHSNSLASIPRFSMLEKSGEQEDDASGSATAVQIEEVKGEIITRQAQRVNNSSKLSNMQTSSKASKKGHGTFIQHSSIGPEDMLGSITNRKSLDVNLKNQSFRAMRSNRSGFVDVMASNAFSISEAIASEGGHNKELFESKEERNNLYNYQNDRTAIIRSAQKADELSEKQEPKPSPTPTATLGPKAPGVSRKSGTKRFSIKDKQSELENPYKLPSDQEHESSSDTQTQPLRDFSYQFARPAKGGSLSPNKQTNNENGQHFILKLLGLAGAQQEANSLEPSSEISQTVEQRTNSVENSSTGAVSKKINQEDDLMVGNEQGTIEPPLFLSPQTAIRQQHHTNYKKVQSKVRERKRSPLPKFDSRQLQYPDDQDEDIEDDGRMDLSELREIEDPYQPNPRPGSSIQASENIPESEQKEQRVNDISLYGSSNPENLKMTKKRNDFQHSPIVSDKNYQSIPQEKQTNWLRIGFPPNNPKQQEDQMSSEEEDTNQTPILMLQPGIEWDEEELLIKSDKIPRVPVTKETEMIPRTLKQHQKHLNITQASMQNASGSIEQSIIFKSRPRINNPNQFIVQDTASALQTPNTQLASDKKQSLPDMLPSRQLKNLKQNQYKKIHSSAEDTKMHNKIISNVQIRQGDLFHNNASVDSHELRPSKDRKLMRQLNNQNYDSGMYNSTPTPEPNLSAVQQEQTLRQSKPIRKQNEKLLMSGSGGQLNSGMQNQASDNLNRQIRGQKQKLNQLIASPRSGELRKRSQDLQNKSISEIQQNWTQQNTSLEETRVITAPVIRQDLRKRVTPKNGGLSQMFNTSDTHSPNNNSQITSGSNIRYQATSGVSQGLSFQQQKNQYGKQTISRQSLQVQGHQGDRLHEDQAL